jgi:small-conductance mechanosensitive channel
VRILGVKLVGITLDNVHKLLLTIALLTLVLVLRWAVIRVVRGAARERERLVFWTRQFAAITATVLLLLGFVSIWFDNPSRLALPIGVVTAAIAFALRKVITALAGYVVLIRGRTFSVGDRIEMGGVRGDVIRLGFVQTTILEMGQPPGTEPQSAWVQARQHTGRVVVVTNDKVFDTPVYNYSRLFSFIWEEIRLPIRYDADRLRAEQILLDCVQEATVDVRRLSQPDRERMKREFFVDFAECSPHVYYRLTDNWLELTVRFIVEPRDARERLDRISRELVERLERDGIHVASTTHEIVGLPPIRIEENLSYRGMPKR